MTAEILVTLLNLKNILSSITGLEFLWMVAQQILVQRLGAKLTKGQHKLTDAASFMFFSDISRIIQMLLNIVHFKDARFARAEYGDSRPPRQC